MVTLENENGDKVDVTFEVEDGYVTIELRDWGTGDPEATVVVDSPAQIDELIGELQRCRRQFVAD